MVLWCRGAEYDWFVLFFFFNDTATTEIYTLSLHDALPIYYDIFGESAIKLDLDSLRSEHPADWLNILHDKTRFDPMSADLYLSSAAYLGVEQIDGEETYVFSGIPIRGANCDAVKMEIWISPRDGLWRKVEYYTSTGKVYLTQVVTSHETNFEIPDEVFKIQLPDEVSIRDRAGE